jgi:hypothetical protein
MPGKALNRQMLVVAHSNCCERFEQHVSTQIPLWHNPERQSVPSVHAAPPPLVPIAERPGSHSGGTQ